MSWVCQGCGKDIFVDENMVIIRDELWLKYFNNEDVYCDECIEDRIGITIEPSDLMMNDDDMIPCNLFWLENRKKK